MAPLKHGMQRYFRHTLQEINRLITQKNVAAYLPA
jgi:hypothetical protein